ncbi:pseudouridine synthase [Polyangium aurulentum]|uniref:pseudouridine synthase n=1 Tax=Polyangium aurulentum TaxID=2567896 RepID=UPI0010AE3364|nr:pseudouridine synthase [Polyangium aurulentum]UQA56047.1 pseudouridine synthase [Polyangium aurulentum]
MEERLQKIIARSGVTSRRAAEELITAGRVRVNGRIVTELGAKADGRRDKIEVDGQRLVAEQPIYLVLHKPRNVVSTLSDPEGRPTVADLVRGAGSRVYPVGRLDFATSGVLLMTNDGEFSNGLLHPRGGVPKTYVLKVKGLMEPEDAETWANGVMLEDGKTLPALVRILRHEEDKTWLEITLREGRNQQIRRMGEATGFPVMRLARLTFAGVTSEGLRPGEWRPLTVDELTDIRKEFGVPKRVRAAADAPRSAHPRARGAVQQTRAASEGPRPRRAASHEGERRAPSGDARRSADGTRARRAPSAHEGDRRPPFAESRGPSDAPRARRAPSTHEGDRRPPFAESRGPSDAPRARRAPSAHEGDRRPPFAESRGPSDAPRARRAPSTQGERRAPSGDARGPSARAPRTSWESKGPEPRGGGRGDTRERRPVDERGPRGGDERRMRRGR